VSLARDLITDHVESGGIAIVATHQELNVFASGIQVMKVSLEPTSRILASAAEKLP